MPAPIVIEGNFADFKLVKTRSVVQMVVEVPIERAAELVAMFGVPQPASEIMVAVARLKPTAGQRLISAAGEAAAIARGEKQPAREHKPKSYAQQAAMLCQEAGFLAFLNERHGYLCFSDVEAAIMVRKICGVESRADIVEGTEAARLFLDLRAEYNAWRMVGA